LSKAEEWVRADARYSIQAAREWPGHGALAVVKEENTMPTPEERDRMCKIETFEEAERAAVEGLGQPIYSRPAPDTSPPVNPAWAPETQADLGRTFMTVLDEIMERAWSNAERAKLWEEMMQLASAKGAVYQDAQGVDSCFRRGLFGLFHNLARKWDRIETVGVRLGVSGGNTVAESAVRAEAFADGERPEDAETLYKTVRDLAVYCIHTLRWLEGEQCVREKRQ